MITVNTNMASIIAQNSLYKSTNKMNTALQRLSTGLRINSAKDDAAGSAISTKLEYKVSSYDVAKDNAQMGQSMLDTANGTLSSINSMLQRMRDLSEQAANGTYGEEERRAMQSEIDALTEEIYRIKNTTEFNGKKILGEEESPKANKMTEAEAIAQGFTVVKNAKELYQAFHNADGSQKLDAKVALFADIDLNELGDLDGNGSNWEAIGTSNMGFNGTFEGNNHIISNLKINNQNARFQGFFGMTGQNAIVKDIKLDNSTVTGYFDVGTIAGHNYGKLENCFSFGSVNGDTSVGGLTGWNHGTIENCFSSATVTGKNQLGGIAGGNEKEILTSKTNSTINALTANVRIGAFTGYNSATLDDCEYNPDINEGMKAVGAGNTNGVSASTKFNLSNAQNISILTNLQVGIDSSSNSVVTIDTGFSLDNLQLNVKSESLARLSLDTLDSLMAKITDKLTDIGSTQNRLISTMEFQEVQRNALTSANSLIKDADIALESANYIKNQILQSVTSSILATANQNPQIALQLI